MIQISIGALASLLGKDAGSLKETVEKDGFDSDKFIKDEIGNVITEKIKEASKTGRDEGYGRGKREVLEDVEKQVAKSLGIEKVGKIEEMVDTFKTEYSKTKTDDPESIRKSKTYLDDVKTLKDTLKKTEDDYKVKLTDLEKKEVEKTVREKALEIFASKKYVLPENETARKNQINTFVDAFIKANKFKVEDGKVLLVDDSGNVRKNEMLDEVKFDEHFISHTDSHFDIAEGDGRSSSKTEGEEKPKVKVEPFKSTEEYFSRMKSESDPETRKALASQYEAQQQKGDFANEN